MYCPEGRFERVNVPSRPVIALILLSSLRYTTAPIRVSPFSLSKTTPVMDNLEAKRRQGISSSKRVVEIRFLLIFSVNKSQNYCDIITEIIQKCKLNVN